MTDETPPSGPAEPAGSVPDPFAGPEWDSSRRRSRRPAELPRPEPAGRHAAPDPDAPENREGGDERQLVRRRRSRYTKRRRRRRILIGSGVVVLALVAAVAWLLYSGLRARHELEAVRAEVRQLRSQIAAGDLDGARATAKTLRGHADEAHSLTTGPVWAPAAHLPWLGRPLASARSVTSGVAMLADGTLPALVEASHTLDPQSLRRKDGSIDLAPIEQVAPTLGRAATSLDGVVRHIGAAPSATWLGSVDSARSDLLDQLSRFRSTVDSASVAAQVVPSMLGADGPRAYMVGFQNEAEVRGTGGLPGAFAILQADHGSFHFQKFESDTELGRQDTGLDFGADFNALWQGSDPTTDYRDSNVSPNFPYAAQVWTSMWRLRSGQQLDGAITLDPTALSYLLRVTGPATLADGTKVGAGNVARLTESSAYERFGSTKAGVAARKDFLLKLAKAVSTKLLDTHADATALVKAAAHAASERRLLVWTRDDATEKLLAPTKIGGVVPDDAAPYVGIAMNNAAVNKLDYYTKASVTVDRTGCGDSRDVTVTMTFKNTAPTGLSDYVYGKYGSTRKDYVPHQGDNLTVVSYYASAGAVLTGITADGKAATASSGTERGHPVFSVRLYLPRGQQRTYVLHLREPNADGTPTERAQPLVNPMSLTVHDQSCG